MNHRSEAVMIHIQPHASIEREVHTFGAPYTSRSRLRSRKSDRTRSSAFSAEAIEAAEGTALVPRRRDEPRNSYVSH